MWKGPLRKNNWKNDMGEMTLNAKKCGLGWIDLVQFNGPSPSKGNNIKSHTNNKGFTFNVFLLFEKYYNNGSFNLVMDLAIDSDDLHLMVLLRHSACTQHKCINTNNTTT